MKPDDDQIEHFAGVPIKIRRRRRPEAWKEAWETFPRMIDILPECRKGHARIRHFDVSESHAIEQSYANGQLWTAGRFCQLDIGGLGVMYDILGERLWNMHVVKQARGDVLIGGLGLGMILHPILANPAVRSVRVLEMLPEVIALVAPSLERVPGHEKLTITEADVEQWIPRVGEAYDCIWMDAVFVFTWDSWYVRICEEILKRYRPYLRPGGWISHWALAEVVEALMGNGPGLSQGCVNCRRLEGEGVNVDPTKLMHLCNITDPETVAKMLKTP